MQRHLRLAALPLLLCWAVGAEAAPRITIAPITGDKRAQVQSQISAVLCKQNTCVSSTRVFTKKKPDWKKIQSANVQGLLVGGIAKAKTGGGREVQLSWLNRPGKAAQSWNLPLTKQGKLTSTSLQTLSGDVSGLASGGAPPIIPPGGDSSVAAGVAAGAAAVAAGPTGGATAGQMTPLPPPEPLPLPVSPTPPSAGGERTLADTPVSKDAGADLGSEGPRHQWRFALEVGADALNRNLSYDTSATLRPYSIGLFVAPHARLELYPIAFFSDGFFAGIGIFGDYSMSLGLKSNLSGDSTTDKGTSYTRWQAGLEWRLRFWKDSDFAIVPFFAFSQQKFVTNGDPTTVGFPGLPQFDLKGYRMGLRFDIPISGSFWIIASADYVLWTTKSVDIQDASGGVDHAATGSGHAIEAELGVNIGLFGPLSLRVFGIYSSTSFSFDEPATNANSATDRYLGGRVMLRLQF